jgi:hypothetical protein
MTPTDRTNALAALRRSQLVRDDSGESRVYRDSAGTIYYSVTSILSATKDASGLESWARRQDFIYGPGAAIQDRDTAAYRGTEAHSQAEFLLKTTNKIARATANKRNAIHIDPHGLPHIPTPVFRWAMGRTLPNIPPISFSAKGYGRSLTGWIAANVTQCHACEFSIYHPAGFAGTADALISVSGETLESHGETPDLRGAPWIADFKTSANRRNEAMLHDYRLQLGAYSLGLQHLTGVSPAGGLIIVARRAGPPDVTLLRKDDLVRAEDGYLERCRQFYEAIQGAG